MKKYNFEWFSKTLKNGMKVLLVHKPQFSQSFFLLGIKAGGMDLCQKRGLDQLTYPSGCAHFLEHQMFRLYGQDVTDQFADLGAMTNAFTGLSETAYYFSTSSNPDKPLSLLMDFVQNLDIDVESVEKEKGIILSEYNMYQQNPETRLMKLVWNALYQTHPIRIDVLGNPEDIASMKVTDLESFYNDKYDPQNMVLVGVTGKEPCLLLKEIEQKQESYDKHFSQLTERVFLKEPDTVAKEIVEDRMDISIPYVALAVKLKPILDPLQAACMDFALQMSLDAWFSSLNPDFQSWMDQRILTTSFGAECEITSDHAYLMFYAQTKKTEEFFQIVEDVLYKMQTQAMDDLIFNSLKNKSYAQSLRTFDHFESFAIDLFQSEVQGVSYFELLDTIAAVKRDEVFKMVSKLDLSHQSRVYLKNYNEC